MAITSILKRCHSMIPTPIEGKAHQTLRTKPGIVIFVAVLISFGVMFVAITMYRTLALANARNELAKAGGTIQIPGYESRYVFRNATMKPTELSQLKPYLKRIPPTQDVNTQLPPCRVLDFTAATAITFADASELLRDMDNTMVLFTHNGRPANVMSPSLRSHLERHAKNKW